MGRVRGMTIVFALGVALLLAERPRVASAQEEADSIPAGVTPETIREGYELFQGASCRSCHGDRGRGGLRGGPNLRDNEWLHSEGDFAGIFQTIRWGVKQGEIKAITRPWEMRPRGGMMFSTEQMQAIAAYLWAQGNGHYEPTVEDLFVDYAFVRSAQEIRSEYRRLEAEHGEAPIAEDRMIGLARDRFGPGHGRPSRAVAELAVEAYPESPQAHFTLGQILVALGDREAGLGHVERALELDPDYTAARNFLEAQRGSSGREPGSARPLDRGPASA